MYLIELPNLPNIFYIDGISFSQAGTNMFVTGHCVGDNSSNGIFNYLLGVPFDVQNVNFVGSFQYNTYVSNIIRGPNDLILVGDSRIFTLDGGFEGNNYVYEFDLCLTHINYIGSGSIIKKKALHEKASGGDVPIAAIVSSVVAGLIVIALIGAYFYVKNKKNQKKD